MNKVVTSNLEIQQLFDETEESYNSFQEFLSEILKPLEQLEPFKSYYEKIRNLYYSDKDEFFSGVTTQRFFNPVENISEDTKYFSVKEISEFGENSVLLKSLPKINSGELYKAKNEMKKHHDFNKAFDERFVNHVTQENLMVLKSFSFPYYSIPFSPTLVSLIESNIDFFCDSAKALGSIPPKNLMMLFHNFVVEPGRKNTHLHKDFDTIFAHRYKDKHIEDIARIKYITYNLAITEVNKDNTPLFIVSGNLDMISPRYSFLKAKDEILRFHKKFHITQDDLLKAIAFAELGGILNIIDLQSRGNLLNYPYYKMFIEKLSDEKIFFVENIPGGGFFVTSNKNLHCSYTKNVNDDYRMTSSMRLFTEDYIKAFYGENTEICEAVKKYLTVLSTVFGVPKKKIFEVFEIAQTDKKIKRVPMCIQIDPSFSNDIYQGATLKMWKNFFEIEAVKEFLSQPSYEPTLDRISYSLSHLSLE
jgi:hypothetical protein